MQTFMIVAAALAMAVALPGVVRADDADDRRLIVLTGTGTVDAAPDQAVLTTGVLAQGATAKAALDANSGVLRNVIDGLKAAGLEPRDMQTAEFSIQPRYTHAKDGEAPRIDGYEVRNGLVVRVRDIARLGQILDTAASLGANQFNGISFVVSDADRKRDAARRAAVADARRQAEIYAEAAGVRLKRVVSIEESGSGEGPRPMVTARMAATAVPIEAGENTLTVSIRIAWEIE